jgi:hypothetical protein
MIIAKRNADGYLFFFFKNNVNIGKNKIKNSWNGVDPVMHRLSNMHVLFYLMSKCGQFIHYFV